MAACRTCSSFFGGHAGPSESGVERNKGNNQGDFQAGSTEKCQKRGKRKKRAKTRVAISYINMQGGRKKAKWLEIEEQLNKEKIGVYAVTETHLRDLEEPPHIDNYVWEGCNRVISERKGGGVGMLIHSGTKWERVKQTCSEHLWVSGTVGGKKRG